jgi:diguanylate cyclase (GGDEF)-like protein/PAS domain S-box-containing protein
VNVGQDKPRRLDRLVFIPVVGSLLVIWITVIVFTIGERRVILERAQSQLGSTVSTLADFNELAAHATGDVTLHGNESRSAAIWRALLQYPTASIWVESNGVISAGQPPAADQSAFIQVEDARSTFTVHAALPRIDALSDWRRSVWQRSSALCVVSVGFLLLAQFLVRALRQRATAESAAAAAQERVTQLALYRTELQQTVALRTGELKEANTHLEKELTDRKAAENALREHDALLNVVTKSAAKLLGTQHEDAVLQVLDMMGQTVAVSWVLLCQIATDEQGHVRATIRSEWSAPGVAAIIDNPNVQNVDLTAVLPQSVVPTVLPDTTSFHITDLSGALVGVLETANMRSFLQIPLMVADKRWGSLYFIDSSQDRREWSWAETDTLETLGNLIGVAIARAQYVKELADANMIVQNSPTILYRLRGEPSLPLIYVSHNIIKFGHDPEKLVSSADWARQIIEPEDQVKVAEAMARVLEQGAQGSSIEFRLRTGDGGHRWVENRYTPVREKDGRLIEVEGIIIDITERKAAEDKIALLARTDALTGLANRSTFSERLRQSFAASRRGANAFAILYIDLDHFKDVNDTLGHPVGDLLLLEVAARLKSSTRDTDLIARLGGDEFAVLQTDVSDPASASLLAAKLQSALGAPYLLGANQVNIVTASIGICPYTANSAGPDEMLAQADLALYRSKDEGRNQYHFHTDDLDLEVLERVTVAEELRKALERDELVLFYQPQAEVISGKIVGMEALIRWKHPQRGLLAAAAFIPLAEKAGLTLALGCWVLEQACRQMRLWRDAGIAPPVMAINLSLSQVKSARELLRSVVDTTAKWGIEPSDLEFDVTEAILAQVTLMQNDVLTQLRLLGSQIAIDDFGTQYSSFEYLRAYRVSHLKIAQVFINNAATDPECAATVRAIMNLAGELDIGVIAEGVETEAQRAMLTSGGAATQAQGNYFSAAVDNERAAELLRQGCRKSLAELIEPEVAQALLLGHRGG